MRTGLLIVKVYYVYYLCANRESNPDFKNRNLACDPLHYRRVLYYGNLDDIKLQDKF